MKDVRAIRGADISSDHHLLLCRLQLKLKRVQKKKNDQLFDSRKLSNEAIKHQFAIELSNRFEVLNSTPVDDINALCDNAQKAFTNASEAVLGYRRGERKTWISDPTWQLVEERKRIKLRMLNGSDQESQAAAYEYREKDKEVKKECKDRQETVCRKLGSGGSGCSGEG